MNPLATGAVVGAATWGVRVYDQQHGLLPNRDIKPIVPGTIQGGLWYQTFINRLRVTTGHLTAATARDVFEAQRAHAVATWGPSARWREYPAPGATNRQMRELIDGWLTARALTEDAAGLLARDFEWWIGGRRYASSSTRPLRTRWNLHAGADVSGMIPSFNDSIASDVVSAADLETTWRVLGEHAVAHDALKDAQPVEGILPAVVSGVLGPVVGLAADAAGAAAAALLSPLGGFALKLGVALAGGYLLLQAVKP